MPKFVDLSGQTFGRWNVVYRVEGKSPAHWLCRCDCGVERVVPGQRLRWGTSQSCGCKKLIDLSGLRFGKWLVTKRTNTISPPFWEVVCDCGTIKNISGQTLRNGESKSCGCVGAERFKNLKQDGELNPSRITARMRHGKDAMASKSPWMQRASSIRNRCRRNNIEYGFVSLAECASYLAAIAPEKCPVFGFILERNNQGFSPKSPSVDRINPHGGYVRGNIQIISMKANAMKSDASQEDLEMFAKWIFDQSKCQAAA